MEKINHLEQDPNHSVEGFVKSKLPRRSFLQYAGAGMATVALVAAGCSKEIANNTTLEDGVDLGSGDFGILNYAYALEQLEAAFYLMVVANMYSGATPGEVLYFNDIAKHEVAHREFFKNALGANAIPALEVDFSTIDFTSRTSVLATAKAFEDLGVSAYNGAGALLESADYLLLAGKIVSVEARHAAAIRDLISNGSFANSEVIDANGLDVSRTPSQVLAIAGTYIKTKINASNLPTS
ncbi:MAG: ferritin-like domain-containing protein [Gloeobacteraceae cyanobacterium ES-bin-316]|nr:ferritin-like domain-containing protein [Ferruginibacter sp.]